MHKTLSTLFSRIALLSLLVLFTTSGAFAAGPMYTPPNVQAQATAVTNPSTLSDPFQLNQQEMVKFPQYLGAYYSTVTYKKANNVGQPQDGTQNSRVQLPPPTQMKQQVDKGQRLTRVAATGFILPSGYYSWDGRTGMVPNPTLAMPGYSTPLSVADSGYIGPTMAMLQTSVDPTTNIRTTSITNNEFATLMNQSAQMKNELRAQPDRWKEAMRSAQEIKQSAQSNNAAQAAEQNGWTGWNSAAWPLINVANEQSWVPCASDQPFKTFNNAAWMVGQMYKQVYMPMAVLLLLPGAILTQVKITVRTGFVPDMGYDDDLYSPFSGILRSIIAVFLIPATQLFVSYTIDVGNSLTYEVVNYRLYDIGIVYDWVHQQTFNTYTNNDANHIVAPQNVASGSGGPGPAGPPAGNGGNLNASTGNYQGKSLNTPEPGTTMQLQPYVSSTGQQWFNTIDSLMSQGMVCLTAFQTTMIMYLFLLGPVAAALYTWPGVTQGDTFRMVYSNWMDGVVLVTLWKFWWVVVILCMSIRLQVMKDLGGGIPPTSTFEQFMAAAFTAILMYVPFNPFDFRPGDLVESVLQQAQSQTSKGGSGGAVGGGASPTGGSTAAGTSSGGAQGPAG